jgi:hypothetical protein
LLYIATDFINTLPDNSSVNPAHHATIDEVVFPMSSALSRSGTTGLCNPFLSNGLVNTFPRIGPYYESGDVINNRDGVFCGVCAESSQEKEVTEFVQRQLRVSRRLEESVQKNFYFRGSRVIEDEIARRLHSDLKC